MSPVVASAVIVVEAVLFSIAPIIPVVSGGRAPLTKVFIFRVVLCAVAVNRMLAVEPLAVAVVAADVFFKVNGADLVLLGS